MKKRCGYYKQNDDKEADEAKTGRMKIEIPTSGADSSTLAFPATAILYRQENLAWDFVLRSLSQRFSHKGVQWEVRSTFVVVKHDCWHALIVFAVKLKAITRAGNQLNNHK